MQDWQLPYLGRRAFPAELTDFELRQFFTFDEIERADIRRAFRSRLRLGAALQLGFLRLTGATLHSMEYVPAAVLKLLGLQLGVPAPDLATLRALYRREMTRMAHQSWAIEYAGFRALDSDGEALLIAFLRDRTTSSITRPRLEQDARAWLHRNSYLIPRARWLTQSVRAAIRTVTSEDHAALVKAVGATSLGACLGRLLERRDGHTMTHLEWLRRPPGKRSLKTMRLLSEKYAWLKERVGHYKNLPISKERQRVYARRFRRRRSSDIPQLPTLRQELEAACFATVTLGTLADDLLRLAEMRISAIWNWAHRVAAEKVTPMRSRTRAEILEQLHRLVADPSLDDASYRSQSAALLVARESAAAGSRAADVREVLCRSSRRIRPVLDLLVQLQLRTDPQHPIRNALEWIEYYHQDKVDWLFGDPPTEWSGRWQPLIEGKDSEQGLRAYEAVTLWGVRRALRNGSL